MESQEYLIFNHLLPVKIRPANSKGQFTHRRHDTTACDTTPRHDDGNLSIQYLGL